MTAIVFVVKKYLTI